MSKYDGCYVKLAGNPSYYAVDDGKKQPVKDAGHMYRIGLRPVHVISQSAFNRIPFVGEAEDEEE